MWPLSSRGGGGGKGYRGGERDFFFYIPLPERDSVDLEQEKPKNLPLSSKSTWAHKFQ